MAEVRAPDLEQQPAMENIQEDNLLKVPTGTNDLVYFGEPDGPYQPMNCIPEKGHHHTPLRPHHRMDYVCLGCLLVSRDADY